MYEALLHMRECLCGPSMMPIAHNLCPQNLSHCTLHLQILIATVVTVVHVVKSAVVAAHLQACAEKSFVLLSTSQAQPDTTFSQLSDTSITGLCTLCELQIQALLLLTRKPACDRGSSFLKITARQKQFLMPCQVKA